jgi:SRSO17 transposase
MGLLMQLPRKSVEPMVLAIEGASEKAVRAMQQFISEGAWDDGVMLGQHWREVDHDLGEPEGVLTLDGSDFHKQGQESVGVKRQYCGELGKRANCQAGVFVGYSGTQGYTLLDRRLYLPQDWVEDTAYAERRAKCGIPAGTTFKTKIELGLEMLTALHEAKTVRCQWLMCDEGFGRDGVFLDAVAGLDLWYFAEVPHDTRVWRERPSVGLPVPSAKGRKPTKERAATRPEMVLDIATHLRPAQWTRHTIKEGSKGPLVADLPCGGSALCGMNCLAQMPGWCCGAPSALANSRPISQMPHPICLWTAWSGPVGCVGPLNPVLKMANNMSAWAIMKSVRGAVGIII